jgi:alpha-tubulin suppressor-like RCC1 family protein
MWGWGYNAEDNLGDNSTTARSSPVAVVGNHLFVSFNTGQNHTLALKEDGSCWSWGRNAAGPLGNNTTTSYSSPVAVVGGHAFSVVASGGGSAGLAHSMALKSDGSVWTWGYNNNGQLGTNNTTSYSSPVAIVGGHSFFTIYAGQNYCSGYKTNGEIWNWGNNASGQLGDSSTTNRSSPVLVVGNHTFIYQETGLKGLMVNVGGQWMRRPIVFINVSGTWMRVRTCVINVEGVWKARPESKIA